MRLLWHGSTPLAQPGYPTAEESKKLHSLVVDAVRDAIRSRGARLVSAETEYQHVIGFIRDKASLCAQSKADIVYTIYSREDLVTLYVEAATRIHVAKPWQALLRGIALYYERRLPVWIIIVSPEKIMYKLLVDKDQDKVLKRMHRGSEGFQPHPNLCSLCELQQYCPYRVI